MMKVFRQLFLAIGLAMLIFGCSDSDSESLQAGIQFRLTDMPGEYQQVNIDIVAIKVIVNDSLIELGTNQGVYNLLEFVNGKDTLLVDDNIPSGYLNQVRLILGENNTVMIDETIHDLKTPSAQQSGLKLQVHQEILGGESYAYTIDFMVDKSIVETGNDKYILKPVIRVFSEAITGSIEGVVQPAEASPLVMAIMDKDTVSTNSDMDSGDFMFRGLPEGTYSVEFYPVDPYMDSIVPGVDVLAGQRTVMDTIFIQ